MDDRMLASRAMSGDLDSFGQLYDAYFGRVFDFAWRTLREGDAAAAVTQAAFLQTLRELPGLGKSGAFEPWLFGIAYRQAVERAERAVPQPSPAYEEAFGSFEAPDPAHLADPAIAGGDHELGALVWEASTALNPRDYALLDLHARQGLEPEAIGQLLGVSKNAAKTMVERMRTAADDVLSSYVVARRGTGACEGLHTALAAHDVPPYTEQARADVDAHIRGCDTCTTLQRQLPSALAIFAAFTPVRAPMALKGDIWRDIAQAWTNRAGVPVGMAALEAERDRMGVGAASVAAGAAIAAGASFDGTGAPPPWGLGTGGAGGWDRRQLMWFGGAVLGLLIFAFAGGAIIAGALDGGDDDGSAAGDGTATPGRTRTVVGTLTPGVAVQTATPDLTASAIPPPSSTPILPTGTPVPLATETALPTTPTPAPTFTPTAPGGVVTVTPGPTAVGTTLIPQQTPTIAGLQ